MAGVLAGVFDLSALGELNFTAFFMEISQLLCGIVFNQCSFIKLVVAINNPVGPLAASKTIVLVSHRCRCLRFPYSDVGTIPSLQPLPAWFLSQPVSIPSTKLGKGN